MVVSVPGILNAAHKGAAPKSRPAVNIVVFVCDILFFISAACISAIFIFHVNNGNIRGIALFGSLVGFIIYYNTAGRLVTKISGFIIRGVYSVVMFMLSKILMPMYRCFLRAISKFGRAYVNTWHRIVSKYVRNSLMAEAEAGYGIFKSAWKLL